MNQDSAVAFAGESRVHIALAVTDLERSKAFYETLLGASPSKERPGYVKFEPVAPSVNLTLNQVEASAASGKTASHFGVQVKSIQAVQQAAARMQAIGAATSTEENTTCCYAVQDKVWVTDPDGHKWEVFVVTQADVVPVPEDVAACCAPAAPGSASTGCC
tara:strand:- start:1334 stop:1816 length:483 start_codon:yes stop_codon:yes gene_type:complete